MSVETRHDVIFYDRRDLLDERVAEFVQRSLDDGHLTAVITTQSTITAIDLTLRHHGTDPDRARADGRLICFDAHDTLATLRTPTGLDWDAVTSLAETLISAAHRQGRTVRLYGEMVALVWTNGEPELAVQLEQHWSRLAATHGFEVLCAYPADAALTQHHTDEINAICEAHDTRRRELPDSGPLDIRAYRGERSTVRNAREFVRVSLAGHHADEFIDTAVLVTSELAANAIEHAKSPYAVELEHRPTGIEIAVRDLSPTLPRQGAPTPDSTSGRGISIVAALCNSWHSTPTTRGKRVAARLDDASASVTVSDL
jgi:MEDS: MEthanogen/methylotroph, DcmR Sensory domain/Histidine kinase-like ATPase domain